MIDREIHCETTMPGRLIFVDSFIHVSFIIHAHIFCFIFILFHILTCHAHNQPLLTLSSHFIKGDHPVDCLQNANLTARVASLEDCDTCFLDCSLNGQFFDEGETWNLDECTVCICKVSFECYALVT